MMELRERRDEQGHIDKERSEWIGRWREDEVSERGVRRVKVWEILGSLDEFPTRKLALRELARRIGAINDSQYRPRRVSTFAQFAERWITTVLVQHKHSTQATMRSHVRKYLVPAFEQFQLRDIGAETVQRFVAHLAAIASPKTVRNIFITLQLMWKSARTWQHVTHNPLDGVVLPKPQRAKRFFFTLEEIRQILNAASEPHRTFYWLAADPGMRAGELCGLRVDDVDFDRGLVNIRQSAWHGKLQNPKSENAVRTLAVSSMLRIHLAAFLTTWRPNTERLLFATRNGTPWDGNLLVKRKFRPLLRELKIAECGLHAFRHANASLMDGFAVPMKVRQQRLGHSDSRLTMDVYTHISSGDDQRIAERLGEILVTSWSKLDSGGKTKGPAFQQALLN